jgi:hypothetical protein
VRVPDLASASPMAGGPLPRMATTSSKSDEGSGEATRAGKARRRSGKARWRRRVGARRGRGVTVVVGGR